MPVRPFTDQRIDPAWCPFTMREYGDVRSPYGLSCAAAHGLELIGGRWTALVLRELMYGPRRFTELRTDINGISANMLASRLREMRAVGLVRKVRLSPPASVELYEATEWALEAAPVLRHLNVWATHDLPNGRRWFLSAASLMLAIETFFFAEEAMDFSARIGFDFDRSTYVVEVARGRIAAKLEALVEVDAIFDSEPSELAGVFFAGGEPGSVPVSGDLARAHEFARLFARPPWLQRLEIKAAA
jgi:DNA-binding HxlR family transcriptional regulator